MSVSQYGFCALCLANNGSECENFVKKTGYQFVFSYFAQRFLSKLTVASR